MLFFKKVNFCKIKRDVILLFLKKIYEHLQQLFDAQKESLLKDKLASFDSIMSSINYLKDKDLNLIDLEDVFEAEKLLKDLVFIYGGEKEDA